MKIVACLLLSSFLITAYAGQKEEAPEGGPPKPFQLPKSEDFTLDNGLEVTMVPYGVIPKIAVRAYVNAGGVNEAANQVWLSRLTGLLMKEGTATRSSEQIAGQAADAGGQLEVEPGIDYTIIGGTVLSDHATQFIDLIADVLQNPALPESEVARLKANLARELAVQRTQPGSLARERFLQVMFPDNPYGRSLPQENDLKSYSRKDVQEFYQANFSAQRTHLYIAGKLQPGLKAAVQKAFSSWPKGSSFSGIQATPVKTQSLSVIDRPDASQSTLYIGLPIADPRSPDYTQIDVMDALLGGSFASRITSNIREQKGYTYSPHSQIGTRHHLAYWVETADVTTAVTGPSIKEIFSEINRLRKEPPSETELKGIQNYLAGLFVLRNTISPDAIIGQLQFVDSQGLDRSYLSEYVSKVVAVKTQDIQAVSEKYLSPDKMEIVVVGDKAKISEQLKPYQPQP